MLCKTLLYKNTNKGFITNIDYKDQFGGTATPYAITVRLIKHTAVYLTNIKYDCYNPLRFGLVLLVG